MILIVERGEKNECRINISARHKKYHKIIIYSNTKLDSSKLGITISKEETVIILI